MVKIDILTIWHCLTFVWLSNTLYKLNWIFSFPEDQYKLTVFVAVQVSTLQMISATNVSLSERCMFQPAVPISLVVGDRAATLSLCSCALSRTMVEISGTEVPYVCAPIIDIVLGTNLVFSYGLLVSWTTSNLVDILSPAATHSIASTIASAAISSISLVCVSCSEAFSTGLDSKDPPMVLSGESFTFLNRSSESDTASDCSVGSVSPATQTSSSFDWKMLEWLILLCYVGGMIPDQPRHWEYSFSHPAHAIDWFSSEWLQQ